MLSFVALLLILHSKLSVVDTEDAPPLLDNQWTHQCFHNKLAIATYTWSDCIEHHIRGSLNISDILYYLHQPVNESWLCKLAEKTIDVATASLQCPNSSFVYSYPDYFLSLKTFVSETIKLRKHECKKSNDLYEEASSLCVQGEDQMFHAPTFDHTIKIIQLSGNVLSALFLAFFVMMYLLQEELRSYGGNHIMCLSIALLCIHVIQGLSSEAVNNHTVCKSVAILMHWLYLCAFLWTSCIAYDLCKSILRPFKLMHIKYKGINFIYVGATVIVPTFVVLTCIAVEFSTNQLIGYGKYQGLCFIHGLWANLFSFVLPVGLLLTFNTVAFVLAISGLCLHENTFVSKGPRGKTIMGLLATSVKVSALLGLPWVLGFIGVSLKSQAILYIFVFLTSFQGVLMYLSFTCNQRVYNFVKELFTAKRSSAVNSRTQHYEIQLDNVCR